METLATVLASLAVICSLAALFRRPQPPEVIYVYAPVTKHRHHRAGCGAPFALGLMLFLLVFAAMSR
jgi:hypothetical protein